MAAVIRILPSSTVALAFILADLLQLFTLTMQDAPASGQN
jgi:hypothetical protein